jgi:uncharacterized protein YjeT (DUF2065 family)
MTIWSITSQPVSTLTGLGTLAVGYIMYWLLNKKKEKAAL